MTPNRWGQHAGIQFALSEAGGVNITGIYLVMTPNRWGQHAGIYLVMIPNRWGQHAGIRIALSEADGVNMPESGLH